MNTLVLRQVPDVLYRRLKAVAAAHRRSMNQEAILALEAGLPESPIPQRPSLAESRRWLEEQVWNLPVLDYRSAEEILGSVSQFIIPIYQRTYWWTQKECAQLWADILRAGASEEIGVHFIGSVVHIDEGLGQPSRIHLYTSRRWPTCRTSTTSSWCSMLQITR